MNPPKISIITVCRNVLPQLQATLASCLAQTYPNKELLVVDGASTDGTPAWLAAHSEGAFRWVSEPDSGIYDAMNKGVAMASGEYVIFMNAGDSFYAPTVLADVFDAGQTADVVYGAVAKRNHSGELQVHPAQTVRNAHRMFFCHQSAFTRRDCLLSHPFDLGHRMSADFKLYKQLVLEGRTFQRLELPVAVFDTTGVSNLHRAAGLLDNISVIREVDSFRDQVRLLPRLYFQVLMCKLR